ncbi:MAG: ATP-binding protein [Sulfuricurvum sp.]|uniref:ATP-binding protein n=1 Tax=Sulfuricurvum sp. TaxID=2025608 RepID=UPI0027261695|nr:ATP-binding protein [Sulfuricurvum sp.]MDO9056404.1 ATP-binding protein [Sulfuricurvum sp.]
MTAIELQSYLKSHYPKENEACEWKEFKNLKHSILGGKGEDLATYISAIANMNGGHIVIGVKDGTLDIVGIENLHDYTPETLPHRLLGACPNLSSEGLFVETHTTTDTSQTIWIVHIPKHLPRKPVYAHNKAWQRSGDSLIELRPEREASILTEPIGKAEDWSAHICAGATLENLDPEAIRLAKAEYITKHPNLSEEVAQWDDKTFLNKAKLTLDSKITNSTLLLLGKSEAVHLLSPAVPRITWVLKDRDGIEQGYEHFGLPLLVSAQKVHAKIRNYKYRYMADSKLFPDEIDKYDPWIIYEALHNCIAHQDYAIGGRINVVEFPDKLVFSNVGNFIPENVENVIERDAPPELYRNPFLCQAMVEINMIDTIGSGIKRIYSKLRQRFFPMPNYKIEPTRVEVTIFGQILDERYAKLLAMNPELSLHDVIALDRVVKHLPSTDESLKNLRDKGLIEGRKPKYHVSSQVAKQTDQKDEYMRMRGIDDDYCQKVILDYLQKFKKGKKSDFEKVLLDKLPSILDDQQKKNKIKNNLQTLRLGGKIVNEGKEWKMSKN